MIAAIVPPDVAAVEARGAPSDGALFLEEAFALGPACQTRVREFTAGRNCGRRALAHLGMRPGPLLRGRDREPIWPAGIVGSITHCAEYCAAAAAPSTRFVTIGIDAEVHARLPRGVLDMIATPEERAWLRDAPADGTWWDRLLFSAKESVFKAWFPVTRRWLGFADAVVTVDWRAATFRASLAVPGPVIDGAEVTAFDGRYALDDHHIVTAVTMRTRE